MVKNFFDKLADTSKTNRSLKEPFDLYWTSFISYDKNRQEYDTPGLKTI